MSIGLPNVAIVSGERRPYCLQTYNDLNTRTVSVTLGIEGDQIAGDIDLTSFVFNLRRVH